MKFTTVKKLGVFIIRINQTKINISDTNELNQLKIDEGIVIFNLRQVNDIGVAFAGTLVDISENNGKQIYITNANEKIKSILSKPKYSRVLRIYDSEDDVINLN